MNGDHVRVVVSGEANGEAFHVDLTDDLVAGNLIATEINKAAAEASALALLQRDRDFLVVPFIIDRRRK